MTPVIAIVGYSNSGKTTVGSYLIQELTAKGYTVAAVKHCHAGYEIDKPGSDTARLFQSGAVSVTASSPGLKTRTDQVDGEAALEDLAVQMNGQYSLILAEGFKSSSVPKILVNDAAQPSPEVDNLLAVVGKGDGKAGTPVFALSELDGLVELVQSKVIDTDEGCSSVTLTVDGVDVSLSQYPSKVLRNLVEGFVNSLKGVSSNPGEIKIVLRN